MSLRTITFTVYQRPFYLRPVLEQWRRVRGIKDWRVEFHIDLSTQTPVQEEIANEFAQWHGNVGVEVHRRRLGVLLNPLHALNEAFATADYVVLAEEDIEVSTDVLEYFDFAAEHPRVLAACAWSDGEGAAHEVQRRRWFNPWCWGTSKAMFQDVIAPTWDGDYSTGDESGPGGWDCNLGLRVVNRFGLDVLFPAQSRSRHIGQWLGMHQDPRAFGEAENPASFVLDRPATRFQIS